MPELKRNFSQAKMNKDLDERLVPNGQYRDATNIQISTSDKSDVGSAQTLLGNELKNAIGNTTLSIPTTSTCVGSIALPETDKIYYMISAGINNTTGAALNIKKDYIVQYDSLTQKNTYVFVDIYSVSTTTADSTSNGNTVTIPNNGSSTINKTGVRLGMVFTSPNTTTEDNVTVTDIAVSGGSNFVITLSKNISVNSGATISFDADRVLHFDKNNIITGINVIDDLLFWTDNATEPKRINIKRSIAGTGGTEYLQGGGVTNFATGNPTTDIFTGDTEHYHTRLVADRDNDSYLEIVTNPTGRKPVYVKQKNVTVIKKSPTQPLTLVMSDDKEPRVNSSGAINAKYVTITHNFNDVQGGDEVSVTFDNAIDYRVGDIIIFTNDLSLSNTSFPEGAALIRAVVTASNVVDADTLHASGFTIRILSISTETPDVSTSYQVRIEDGEVLFEFKFVRFSYRYKYTDGEYSTFAPFSQVAFIPGEYDYLPKKGYNLGMRNTLRNLKLKDYYPEELIQNDVVAIDLLYKEDGNPTVYTVKTLTAKDDHPIWPDLKNHVYDRGEFSILSELIHAVLPSNQLLRPYDNVPRIARAQEVSANRIIYGNYLQNYTADDPDIEVSIQSSELKNVTYPGGAAPSVKSQRTYQVGVVFSDEYGRETPVLTSKNASVTLSKETSVTRNRIFARIHKQPPSWATHFSFYVKETSSEYYNMAMDRWYYAADGNIWISFPSSERNKLTIDDYIILKKAHRTDEAVFEKARYKVLAIENEAPEFIKTTKKKLGELIDSNKDKIGDGSFWTLMPDYAEFGITRGAFISTFGEDILISTPDKMSVQIKADDDESAIYDVTSIKDDGSNFVVITVRGTFGDDMNFTSTAGTYATRIDNLRVILSEDEVENRPEFDGRFFVKIHRDQSLAKYILLSATEEDSYKVKCHWGLRYINNNGYKNVPTGGPIPSTGARQALENESNSLSGKNHPTEYSHFSTYEWGGGAGRFGVTAANMHTDPVNSLGNDSWYTNGNPEAKSFWKGVKSLQDFFIDACTAYQWTGHKNHIPGDVGNGSSSNGFYSVGTKPDAEGAWYNSNNNFSSMKKAKGVISRGIWNNNTLMDISWSGMGKGYDGGNWSSRPFNHKLQDFQTGIRAEAYTVIQNLIRPGTIFRFRNDPDKTVYTTEEYDYQNVVGDGDFRSNATPFVGAYGIRNYKDESLFYYNRQLYRGENMRQRWTIKVDPPIGSGVSGYNPITGTTSGVGTSVRALKHDARDADHIEILEPRAGGLNDYQDTFTENPALWEVEPKESVDVDIYYQASGLMPLELNADTNEEYVPIGSTFRLANSSGDFVTYTVLSWSGQTVTFSPALTNTTVADNSTITFAKRNYYGVGSKVNGQVTSGQSITLHGERGATSFRALSKQYHFLDWFNCYTFGNGVESDRSRDSFNKPQLANGVKASTVLAEPVKEERRKHGLIFSGIYNSISGVNNTNQFIAAEKITKDLNPIYGSIQKLYTRPEHILTICEDKVLKVLSKRDALFNADGNKNVAVSDKVLGAATAYSGDYGISTNPESFVAAPDQVYFADISRGQVLALSGEGVRSISSLGMKDYFTDLFRDYAKVAIGSYDEKKREYNLTVGKKFTHTQIAPEYTTITYSAKAKGWVSFKSYKPEQGLSLNNEYYTFKNGQLWKHHANNTRNNFYGVQYDSDVTVVFNDIPESVKSFGTINYEGTQARITQFTTSGATAYDASGNSSTVTFNDSEYYNLAAKKGWYIESITTNMQTGKVVEFKNKEDKYFGTICGDTTTLSNLDEREFSVQGLGTASFAHSSPSSSEPPPVGRVSITIADNVSTTYQGDDGTGGAWDTAIETNWEASNFVLTETVGSTVSGQFVDLIISNVVNGSYTGFNLSASNFKIGGASSSGSNIWTGGNKDTEVTQVQFIDNGIAGDPLNTVTARVTLSSFTVPSSNKNIYIDIDSTTVSAPVHRNLCLRSEYDYSANQTVTYTPGTGVSRANADDGVSSGITKDLFQSSSLVDGTTHKVATFTFTRNSNYYYKKPPSIFYHNLVKPGYDYTGAYNEVVTLTPTGNKLTSFTVEVFYTPPQDPSLNPDPPHLCKLHHKIEIHYELLQPQAGLSNIVTNVSVKPNAPKFPNENPVIVTGAVGATYTVAVTQATSLTNSSATQHYNFTTSQFQGGSTNTGTVTIPASGFNTHNVILPNNTGGKKRFDVVVAAVGETTLASSVPNALGDSTIIQEGISTLTLETKTYTNNFGSMVNTTIKKPTDVVSSTDPIFTTGGTAGNSSTTITLDVKTSGIVKDMLVLVDTPNLTSGQNSTISNNTKVVSIRDDRFVTVSSAVTLTDGIPLVFQRDDANVKTFELTVTPASDQTLTITSNGGRQPQVTDIPTGTAIRGVSHGTNPGENLGTLNLQTTNGIFPGMTFVRGDIIHTVASITNGEVIAVTPNLAASAITEGTDIIFTKSDASKTKILNLSAEKVQNNIKIRGVIEATRIPSDETINIYIDEFIKTT